jgi:hypothetical protein
MAALFSEFSGWKAFPFPATISHQPRISRAAWKHCRNKLIRPEVDGSLRQWPSLLEGFLNVNPMRGPAAYHESDRLPESQKVRPA